MLENGLNFMAVGMGVVFGFLVLMVIAMIISAKVAGLLSKFFPEPLPVEKPNVKGSDDSLVAAAIAIARARG